MLFKELNIIGFGKFKNKRLILKDGINLIYGENEAGKSTLHSFIDGMFYGLLKPNVRSALYLEEHEKYSPWDKSRYAGIIHFEHEGKSYRIERNFAKGEENTKVLDETTGVDITKSIDVGSGRVLQPGIHFFGFNTRVFSNTISIKQLGTKTDDKLANEVSEKLINITTTLDDNISVDKAISELRGNMVEIGTDRAPTKPYAINLKSIESLEDEKRKILIDKGTYESYLEEKSRLNNLLDIEEVKLSDLRDRLEKDELVEKMKILQEAQILSDEIINLEGKIVKLSTYANLSMDKYKEGINLSNSIEFINNNIVENKTELDSIEIRLRSVNGEENARNDLELIKRDYKSCEDKIKKYKLNQIISLIFIVLAFGATVIVITTKRYLPISILLPVFGVIGGYYSSKIKEIRINMIKIKNQIPIIEAQENKSRELKSKKEDLINRITDYESKRTNSDEKLIEILGESNVKDLEEMSQGLDNKTLYEKNISKLETKKELLERILGKASIDSLIVELENLDIEIVEGNIDKNQLKYEIERSNESISDLKIALKGVEENLNHLGKNINRLVEIEEDIERKTIYKEELDKKLKSFELAIQTIEEISKGIHSQFAPTINRKVGEIVDKITTGKYNNIKISESLNISVENPINKEIIEIESLSGGTIDQLYFSLRFGIINSMVGDKLPLILDDCFIQYDDIRLKNVMKFLIEIGSKRQIILFTCHNREKRLLDELSVNFNYINLT